MKVTGRTGDGGIDGECAMDRLGLYKAKFQAKRWKNSVSSGEVRDFIGALTTERVDQGIFVTTSSFTPDAVTTAQKSGKVKLIDGKELARMMVESGQGVTKKTLDIPKIDEEYFSGLT
nr:restriction endonuclease [Ferrimicrobium acidiphilum]